MLHAVFQDIADRFGEIRQIAFQNRIIRIADLCGDIFQLQCNGKRFERIAERIYQFEEVESLYLMSGAYDFAVTITGRTLREVASFVSARLSTIEGVTGTATHFILKKYKEKGVTFESQAVQEERMKYV